MSCLQWCLASVRKQTLPRVLTKLFAGFWSLIKQSLSPNEKMKKSQGDWEVVREWNCLRKLIKMCITNYLTDIISSNYSQILQPTEEVRWLLPQQQSTGPLSAKSIPASSLSISVKAVSDKNHR